MDAAYARRYRELWDRHWWWRSREALLLAEVRRIGRATPLRRMLDIGCGDGLFFDRLGRLGEVEGIEPDGSLVADPRWRDRIEVAPLEATRREASSYDLVLMLDVLEHIEDDASALASARALARPGGALLLTVPALPWLWSRHDEANAHFRRYTPATLAGALARAGFAVETIRFVFAWTVAPMVLRRWLAPAGRGSADYDVSIPPGPINGLLAGWSKIEHALGRRVRWPLGSSLLAVARRPGPPPISSLPPRGGRGPERALGRRRTPT